MPNFLVKFSKPTEGDDSEIHLELRAADEKEAEKVARETLRTTGHFDGGEKTWTLGTIEPQ